MSKHRSEGSGGPSREDENDDKLGDARRPLRQEGCQDQELKNTLEEEKLLIKIVEGLETSIQQVNQGIQGKDDEIARMTRKVDRLKGLVGAVANLEAVGGGGGRDAVSILPEEVWEVILQKLTEPKDLWNSSNTCSLFNKILKDWKKPTWLFKECLPHLFQYLPQNMVLKCRLVSRGWNRVVDRFLENGAGVCGWSSLTPAMSPLMVPMEQKMFFLLNKFDFRRGPFRIEDPGFPCIPGRNPFLGRGVTLILGLERLDRFDYDTTDEYLLEQESSKAAFWQSIYSFLRTFGEHIWYLTLDSHEGKLHERDQCHEEMLQLLTKDVILLIPNLRKLRIIPSMYERNPAADCGEVDIDMASLPVAPKLETIQADSPFVDGGHLPLVALVRGHHAQLRVLHLTDDLLTPAFFKLEWPNLEELHLDQLVSKGDFETLLQTGSNMPHLRKLGVNLRGHGSFDALLDVIHGWLPTIPLATLQVRGGIYPYMFQQSTWKSCMSPSLTTLEVELDEGLGFLEFLLYFPLVKNLHLFWRKSAPYYRTPRVHFNFNLDLDDEEEPEEDEDLEEEVFGEGEPDVTKFIFKGEMYRSNIWELLPQLQLFTFEWGVFTRAGYEQFMERRGRQDLEELE